MTNTRVAILVAMAVVVAVAVWIKAPMSPVPPPASTTVTTPAPVPAPPPVAAPATPAETKPPEVAPTPAPETTAPPASTTETPPPTTPPSVKTADPFGEEQTLTPRKVVILKGQANWDSAFESLVGSLKTLSGFLEKQGVKPAGSSLIVYTSTDDAGFTYQAEIPVDEEPKNLAKGMSIGNSPEGPTLKFVHRGSYDNMDNTYEAITNHLDDKKLEAKDTFIEEYVTDPLKTTEDNLVINVFVPLK